MLFSMLQLHHDSVSQFQHINSIPPPPVGGWRRKGRKMKAISVILILVVIGALVAMNPPSFVLGIKPSADKAAREVGKLWSRKSGGNIRVVNFHKTNAREGDLMGVPFYEVDYQAEVEFLRDGYLIGSPFSGSRVFVTEKPDNVWDWKYHSQRKEEVKVGQRIPINGSIAFQKTERGWVPLNGPN